MIDVDEVYKVPLKALTESSTDKTKDEPNPEEMAKKMTKTDLESATANLDINSDSASSAHFVKNLNLYKSGRFNLFERHVNQMFIRGDNIVTIVLAD